MYQGDIAVRRDHTIRHRCDLLVDLLDLRPVNRLLDVGSGAGTNYPTTALRRRFGTTAQLVGSDRDRAKVRAHPPPAVVLDLSGDDQIETLGLFDGVHANGVLHFIRDLSYALERVRSLTASGGTVVALTLSRPILGDRVQTVGFYGRSASEYESAFRGAGFTFVRAWEYQTVEELEAGELPSYVAHVMNLPPEVGQAIVTDDDPPELVTDHVVTLARW